jgi:hypothetical protein
MCALLLFSSRFPQADKGAVLTALDLMVLALTVPALILLAPTDPTQAFLNQAAPPAIGPITAAEPILSLTAGRIPGALLEPIEVVTT